ncbi:MAG: hypothetical protein WDW38_009892 [Sanguina aurantia]
MVVPKGYPLEEHHVVTSDGYTLRTFRIAHGRNTNTSQHTNPSRPPVLLLHGVSLSSTCWVVNEPSESLAFILADAGYDVWMMNNRGNTFARKQAQHSDLSPDFWRFSLDELITIDLPDTLNYVLQATGYKTLAGFIGHSQGGSVGLGAMAYDPSLGSKMGLVMALAPSVYVKFASTPLLVQFAKLFPGGQATSGTGLVSLISPSEFAPMDREIHATLLDGFCQDIVNMPQCRVLVETIFGASPNIKTLQYRKYFQQWPASTSTWNVLSWAQLFNSATPRFCLFNQGAELDLRRITAPVILFTGGRDQIASAQDNALVRARLTEGGSFREEVITADYAHMDFIWDTNARTKVYPTLLAKLDAASKQRFLGFHETMVQALPLQFQHSDVQRLVQGLTTSP